MIEAPNLVEFRIAMENHEDELSRILGVEKIASSFKDLPGSIKSLGAWGGDFVMIATEVTRDTLQQYLSERGIQILFSYKELVYEKAV